MRRIAIALTLLIFGLEIYGRNLTDPPRPHYARRSTDGAYISPEFSTEGDKAERANLDGTTFEGEWITIHDGWRTVQGQPESAACTIWLFGNSTVYGYDVADGETIPDALQRLTSCRVENRGIIAASVSSLVNALRDTEIKANDIVIVMSGVLEPQAAYVDWHGEGEDLPQPGRTCYAAKALRSIGLYKVYCQWVNTRPYIRAPIEAIRPAVTEYRAGLVELRALVDERGLTLYHVLQPHILSIPMSATEQADLSTRPAFIARAYAVADVWAEIRVVAYDVFPDTIDLTHILDQRRRAGETFYLDCCHVNVWGSAIVARALADAIGE